MTSPKDTTKGSTTKSGTTKTGSADAAARSPEKQQRLASVYDAEVLPVYARRFGQMALRALDLRPAANVLEIGCATGDLTMEVARRLDGDGRVTALEASVPMLAQAEVKRAAAGPIGAKVSLRDTATPLVPTLVLDDNAYDICLSNLAVADAPDPRLTVAELAHMLKPGGQLVVTLPLRGTWGQFLDIYRDVLRENRKPDSLAALDSYIAAQPEGDTVARWMEEAGLSDVEVTVERWELLFRSAREFFFAPVIDLGPLSRWKQIAGRGDEMQDIFFFIKQAIDAYFAGGVFSVTIVGGCCKGWRAIPAP
jgi:ubiquinone/menaquinone biosynthesis C-methylase UbiE